MWNSIISLAATALALFELAKDWREHKTTWRRITVLSLIMLVGIGGAISTYYSEKEADRRHSEDQMQIARLQATVEAGNATLKEIVLILQLKQATPFRPYTVSLSWKASGTSDVVKYEIFRSEISGGAYARIAEVPAATTSYEDKAVKPGSTYYYVVSAVNSRGVQTGSSNEQRKIVPAS